MIKKQKHPPKKEETVLAIGPMPFAMKSILKALKDKDTRVVFVDGGLVHREKLLKKAPLLIKNAISLGDGDSSKRPMTIKKTDQNISDLSFFLKTFSRKSNIGRFLFAGFLGGREDHQVFNLGELIHFIENHPKKKELPRFLFEDKIEFLPKGVHQLSVHGTFSIASLSPNKIKITGECQYQSKTWIVLYPLSSRGVSNVGSGIVTIETKKAVMVFYPKL